MVRSYDDFAKQKARDKLLYFIYENLLTKKKPENIKVVCFPGAEKKGEEGLEIKLIYDELGIPRENIFGLERDPDNVRRLHEADLGIQVIPLDAYDFFSSTNEKFDVISLDYMGPRTYREADITRFIAGKQLLNEWGIYCTNHCGQREGNSLKKNMLNHLLSPTLIEWVYADIPKGIDKEEYAKILSEKYTMALETYQKSIGEIDRKEFDLELLRRQIFQSNILSMAGGIIELDPKKSFLYLNASVRKIIENAKNDQSKKKSEGIVKDYPHYWTIKNTCQESIHHTINDLKRLNFNDDLAKKIIQAITLGKYEGYAQNAFERYSYNSNKNYKMNMDMVQYRKIPRKLYALATALIDFDKNGMAQTKYANLKPRKVQQIILEIESHPFFNKMDFPTPEPTYLGSSWVPPKRKKTITQGEAIELLREGFEAKDILQDYKGFTVGQLAAFKAHYVTMGKPFEGN